MVTDDPETPADGHWEMNFAGIATRTPGRWEIAAPDADINYGWGNHIQLKLELPWSFVREAPQGWKSGLGAADAGIKWRFIDKESAGFSMSTYPQITWNWLSSSERRGITSPGQQFFLPLEAATVIGEYRLDAEVGRNFVQAGANQWVAGLVVARDCIPNIECLAEVHETAAVHDSQTLLNFGARWKLPESLSILAAAGREFGPHSSDQRHALIYLGVQVLR